MWKKPWTLKEGFAIGLALCAVGLLLQSAVGPIRWDSIAWPSNLILLLLYSAWLLLTYLLRQKVYLFRWGMTFGAAIPALALTAVLAVVLGLMDGLSLLSHWTFVLIYGWTTSIVGLVSIKRLHHFRSWKRDIPFLLNHLGLFLALVAGTLGNADMQRLHTTLVTGQMEWRAVDANRQFHELPFSLTLRKFILEEYPPQPVVVDKEKGIIRYERTPKRYASEVTLSTSDGKHQDATIEVNHPLTVEGWKIYQLGYDECKGKDSDISILELVRDPWLPFVYAGIYMLIAGAVWMFLTAGKKENE